MVFVWLVFFSISLSRSLFSIYLLLHHFYSQVVDLWLEWQSFDIAKEPNRIKIKIKENAEQKWTTKWKRNGELKWNIELNRKKRPSLSLAHTHKMLQLKKNAKRMEVRKKKNEKCLNEKPLLNLKLMCVCVRDVFNNSMVMPLIICAHNF